MPTKFQIVRKKGVLECQLALLEASSGGDISGPSTPDNTHDGELITISSTMSIIAKRNYSLTTRRSSLCESLQNRRRSSITAETPQNRRRSSITTETPENRRRSSVTIEPVQHPRLLIKTAPLQQNSDREETIQHLHNRRQLFHDKEKVINESGESRISGEGEGAEHPQTNTLMVYPQLLIAVAKNSFPEVAIAVQDVLKNQEPILNLQKRDLYLEAVRTRNVPIIREVMVSIRPCALFPKHYKFTVMMESISAGDPEVVDVVCKMLLPRSKLTKEDTVRILEGALAIDNQHILVSICASLKTKRLVERDHAYGLLLKAVESKDLIMVLHILRAIRPRRKLTSQQNSCLLQTSVDSGKLEIVKMILRMCGKIPTDEITKCLIQAVKSTPDIFLHLIHKLKPKLSESALDNLLNSAYIVEGNYSLTSHIIKHYPPPPNIAHKFLQLFIRDSTEVLIPAILAHVNRLTNEEVQHICGLSLKTCSNLFRFFAGTHDCPRETISEIVMDHLHHWNPGGSCVSSYQTRPSPGLSDTLVQVLKSLQFSESNILKNLYLNCAKSGNSHALGLLNNSESVNREKCILDALENLLCHSSHAGPIEVLLHSHSMPTKEFIARLEVLTKNSRADKLLIAAVQKYTSNWKYRESEI